MKAFVLAGGEGTRLKPYTYYTPKPMLMLGNKPILQYVLENLKRCGIRDVIITVGNRHEAVSAYFGDGKKLGMNLSYSVEAEKMDTAGSILPFKGKVKESFAVVMGDHLTNIDIGSMQKHHKKAGAFATVALLKSQLPLEYGVAEISNGSITGFMEKPLLTHYYNTAIYIFEPEVFDYIRGKEDFAKHVIPRMLAEKKKISAFIFDDVWFDIGRVSDYERLKEMFDVQRLIKDLA